MCLLVSRSPPIPLIPTRKKINWDTTLLEHDRYYAFLIGVRLEDWFPPYPIPRWKLAAVVMQRSYSKDLSANDIVALRDPMGVRKLMGGCI